MRESRRQRGNRAFGKNAEIAFFLYNNVRSVTEFFAETDHLILEHVPGIFRNHNRFICWRKNMQQQEIYLWY